MVEIFTRPLTIVAGDIDELGHVNNIVYLRWAQDVAIAHWRARASREMTEAYVWVVTRHEVDYRAALELGDAAEARTWVDDEPRGPFWGRSVEIGKPGAKAAAHIKSTWCLLDAQTRRVKRVPAEISSLFGAGRG
ncbi:MAG TPA: thioesterase family protein [Caulobacterales bacterium]|nr:thioesterase family protein [Caulobacterales bacterium]